MNRKEKGNRIEYKTRDLLAAIGYVVTRAAGSHGPFDIIAQHPTHTRCIQVKANRPPSPGEREQLRELKMSVPITTSVEIWVWKDRVRHPVVEVVT